ncbi:hypothetical protein [Mycolicibacterium sp. CH28]|nr:hypothetical protein [Mycolicibacterium sp. CH28]
MASGPLTMMFWPESAYGPTNQCIGLAAILRDALHVGADVIEREGRQHSR